MSIKVMISASEEQEREEIIDALTPVIRKRHLKVKKKFPIPASEDGKFRAYVETRKSIAYDK